MFIKINNKEIPEYYGRPYIEINNNKPTFPKNKRESEFFVKYSKIGRFKICDKIYPLHMAYACIDSEHMPCGKYNGRNNKNLPEFFKTKYDFIKGKYLFNNCHLIGRQLSGDKSKKNLIIGTRYMNEIGMLPFENKVAEYVNNTGNHVLYRVTPVFDEDSQLVKGVQMEAFSVEDDGEKICFNVFIYNVQPGVFINYKDGSNKRDDEWCSRIFTRNNMYTNEEKGTQNYILNIGTNIFHKPDCNCVPKIKASHRRSFDWARKFLEENGCKSCGNCNP